jgi:hypothetical protein
MDISNSQLFLTNAIYLKCKLYTQESFHEYTDVRLLILVKAINFEWEIKMMVLMRVDPLSAAKVMGIVYAFMGFLFGAFMTLLGVLGNAAGAQQGPGGILFGVGAVIVLPIVYGIGGFVGGIISAAVYNFVVSMVGGIEFEFVTRGRAYEE